VIAAECMERQGLKIMSGEERIATFSGVGEVLGV
jgi:hypothetical protein